MNENTLYKYLLPCIYILGWIFLYTIPRRYYHIGGDDGTEGWLVFILILLVLPFTLYYGLKKNNISKTNSKGIVYASVFLAVPFILLIDSEDQKELELYKKETIGIISKSWFQSQRKRKQKIWNVKAEYFVEGRKYYTSTKRDEKITLLKGDTVHIIYSSETPGNSEIKELIEYYEN